MITITWTGTNGYYKSTDGRFVIMRGVEPQQWILFDKTRVDVCVPEYPWTQYCCTLASAKRYAAKYRRTDP